ncbi:MAG: porin [Planctomycetota bacterium]
MKLRSWPVPLALGALGCVTTAPLPVEEPASGFRLESADGSTLELGALVQVLGRWSDDARDPTAQLDLKRVRPEISGELAGSLAFNIEPNFSENEVELEEAWVGPKVLGGRATLHIGRMKAPFNLEEVRSRRFIDFPYFSIVNQLAPAEDHGLFLNGASADGRHEYGFALYNGTGSADTNASKDVAARWMLHPFAGHEASRFANLQFGLAGTLGSQDEEVGELALKNETRLDIIPFADDARLDGTRERLGLELAWFAGPWFVQGEYLGMRQEMSSGAGEERVLFHGGYLTLARVLTGETRTFRGVTPVAPFDFATGTGRGAWTLAVRYSVLNLDDDLEAALIEPGNFTDQVQTGSVGLNWTPNRHALVRTSVVGSFYEGDIRLDTGSGDREAALLVEFQLHY